MRWGAIRFLNLLRQRRGKRKFRVLQDNVVSVGEKWENVPVGQRLLIHTEIK